MIMGLPTPCRTYIVCLVIPKDSQISYGSDSPGRYLDFYAPIELKPEDRIMVDTRTGHVEEVERNRFVIWRSGWLN